MSTRENPYVAPLAESDPDLSVETASELLAMRQRHVSRETTLRAWGLAKLIIAPLAGAVMWAVLSIDVRSGELARQYPWSPPIKAYIYPVCVTALFLAPGFGLLRLRSWGRWLQVLQSAGYLVVSFGFLVVLIRARAIDAYVVLVPVVVNGALVALALQPASRVVCSRRYRDAVRITSLRRVVWPILVKLVGYTVVELVQMLSTVLTLM